MDTTLVTTLLTVTITTLTTVLGLVDSLSLVHDVSQQIVAQLNDAISSLKEALELINASASAKQHKTIN